MSRKFLAEALMVGALALSVAAPTMAQTGGGGVRSFESVFENGN